MAEAATLDGLGGWASVLGRLTAREDLPADLVSAAFTEILEGRASPVHIAGFAIGLRTKGESVRELGAILSTLLAHA